MFDDSFSQFADSVSNGRTVSVGKSDLMLWSSVKSPKDKVKMKVVWVNLNNLGPDLII